MIPSMFIELLISVAILGYLYSTGFLSFGSPGSIAISVGLVVGALALSCAISHFFARRIVDSIFGFDSWSRVKTPVASRPVVVPQEGRLVALRNLTIESPADKALSKMYADALLSEGLKDDFIREKLRFVSLGSLADEETTAVFHRLADIEWERGNHEQAVEFLQRIVDKFPDSTFAHNARHRMGVLQENGEVSEKCSE
ncbi:hypothetical protein CVU37_11140 [candidate division BRC1 bacterium HGW-BRC1-1]|jgi:hypothetical protein|nr:MAG: hypothetical protein CVU37_11140 [candidate division BRC1 bacterium HGW-BRC1-1]